VFDSLPSPNENVLPPAKKQALPVENTPRISSPSRVLSVVSIKNYGKIDCTNGKIFDRYVNNKSVLLFTYLIYYGHGVGILLFFKREQKS
jgi:hypothetical protein